MGAADLVESIDNSKNDEFYNYEFYVTCKEIPKINEGLWLIDSHSHFRQGFSKIKLDKEDLEYLYNKYKPLAADDLKEKEEKRIKDERESITKEMESLERKMGKLKDRMKKINTETNYG